MATRDKVIRTIRSQIDQLNKKARKLEVKAKKARDGVKQLQKSSAGAFKDIRQGASGALRSMRRALGKARKQFSAK